MGSITTAMCNSFKTELLGGVHDLDSNELKIALIKPSPTGTYGVGTTNYTDVTGNSDEATGTGYTPAGGRVLDTVTISLDGNTAIVDIDDEKFPSLTLSADGAIIYNNTATGTPATAGRAIAVFNFGSTVTATNGDFTVVFPTADASNAVIRIT